MDTMHLGCDIVSALPRASLVLLCSVPTFHGVVCQSCYLAESCCCGERWEFEMLCGIVPGVPGPWDHTVAKTYRPVNLHCATEPIMSALRGRDVLQHGSLHMVMCHCASCAGFL